MQNEQALAPHARFVESLMALVHQYQQDLQAQKVQEIEAARVKNTRIGRPKVSFDVEQALKLRMEGFSWGQISKAVNASSGTVRRVIQPLLPSNPASN